MVYYRSEIIVETKISGLAKSGCSILPAGGKFFLDSNMLTFNRDVTTGFQFL